MTTVLAGATGLGAQTHEEAVEATLVKVRECLFSRGNRGLASLGRTFDRADFNGNKKLDMTEFDEALRTAGVFLGKLELNVLFKEIDRSGDGNVNYDEFLRALKGGLNDRRRAIVEKAFAAMDRDGSGVVTVDDISGVYDASKHPDVIEGKATEEDILVDFLSSFEGAASSGAGDGRVTQAEFVDYYTDLSASVPADDYFCRLMEQAWCITEDESGPVKEQVERFEKMLVTKAEQKCKSKGGSGRRDVQALFAHFDKDGSGAVALDEFGYAMLRFGIPMERKLLRTIFDNYDTDGSGQVTVDEFCARVFGEDRT